jgi:hypothetical protein
MLSILVSILYFTWEQDTVLKIYKRENIILSYDMKYGLLLHREGHKLQVSQKQKLRKKHLDRIVTIY